VRVFEHILRKTFALKEAAEIQDIDSAETSLVHRRIIQSKPFLKGIYRFFYHELIRDFDDLSAKKILEIGAGAFNSQMFYPRIITSDIEKNDFVDMAVDARRKPFGDKKLDGIILLETLHHIGRPEEFFKEAQRVLKTSGKLVMIEPYFSFWGGCIYRYLHHEPVYDIPEWDIPQGHGGRLSNANVIMPHNIFIRDREIFERKFPDLKIRRISLHTCFNYLLSGGLSYKCLVPGFLESFIWFLESALSPFYKLLATNMTVVIEKK